MDIEALRKKALSETKKKVKEAYMEKDRYIIQAVETVDDLDTVFNLLVARVREWYSLHFPELSQSVKDHEAFLRIVAEVGRREDMGKGRLEEIVGKERAEKIREYAEKSMGTDMGREDYAVVKKLAELALDVRDTREEMAEYVKRRMKEVCPNLSKVAGPILGARLLAKAGGLKKIAFLPASTIQVIGAEKALFRHLTKGTRPPKHGIIFQHPLVRNAKRWQRGKIARSLAAKIAIAVREDYFGGKDIGERLLAELEERVKEIKEKYPEPPKKEKGKGRKRKGKGRG